MEKYVIDKSTLSTLADNIRDISGESEGLSTLDILSLTEDTAYSIDEQTALIQHLGSVLQEKSAVTEGIVPEGTVSISSNGIHDVTLFEKADVQVPVPDGYILPLGAKMITENGNYGVREYAAVIVDVPTVSGGMQDSQLPDGYARLSGIKFTGDQTVDTGIVIDQDMTIKIAYTRDGSSAMYMFGVVNDGNTASVTAYLSSNGTWRFGNKGVGRNVETNSDLVHTAVMSKTGISSPNLTNTFSGTAAFETIGSLTIGAVRNASGSIASSQFVGKIFAFEIWDGATCLLKLIPAVNSAGVCGFWDTVKNKFHTSITATPLEAGHVFGE